MMLSNPKRTREMLRAIMPETMATIAPELLSIPRFVQLRSKPGSLW